MLFFQNISRCLTGVDCIKRHLTGASISYMKEATDFDLSLRKKEKESK
jgi:hypothetical protein